MKLNLQLGNEDPMDLEVPDDSFGINNEMWKVKMGKSQYERAHELAEFVRGYAIANAPSFGDYAKSRYENSSWQCAYEHLADEIESLALIESAPAKKNTRAIELANKLEESYDSTENFFTTLCDVLGYESIGITTEKDMKNLCEAIRNLDAPEDGMQWPLDKDGVPCKIGDIVFYKDYDFAIEYANDEYVVYSDYKGDMHEIKAKEVTHKKPRTLDDILQDAPKSCVNCEDDTKILDLIREAYELGKKETE